MLLGRYSLVLEVAILHFDIVEEVEAVLVRLLLENFLLLVIYHFHKGIESFSAFLVHGRFHGFAYLTEKV